MTDNIYYRNEITRLKLLVEHQDKIINAYQMFEGRVSDSLHKTNDSRLEQAFETLEEDMEELKL